MRRQHKEERISVTESIEVRMGSAFDADVRLRVSWTKIASCEQYRYKEREYE